MTDTDEEPGDEEPGGDAGEGGEAEDEAEEKSQDDDRAALLEELDHLKVDLALKDAYATELSARLAQREQEVAALAPALVEANQRVAAQEAELARLRAAVVQVQVQLDEITGRAGYRLLARASTILDRHDGLRRVATGTARRLSRG
ncbi:MAG TPA: hypothetical protein VHF00_02955 [Acidimicrobiales bacterium]|jgi:chromosome segregation ATPase|nr:hypothetical protein [Acidimicrobiales bacterium]